MLYRYRTWLLTFDMFSLVLLWLLYLVLFATTTQFLEYILLSFDNTLNKIVSYTLRNILMNIYAWIGMISMFVTAMKYTNKYGVSKIIEELGELCFGVYIFQQFILQFLYYYTPIPDYVNPLYLPWIGFSITLLTSIILTYIIKKTKLRFFI